MAAAIQTQLHKVQEKVKPYLYEGPLSSYWAILEQKTKLKREQVALGILFSLLLFLSSVYNLLCH
jgi:hypothetical protein